MGGSSAGSNGSNDTQVSGYEREINTRQTAPQVVADNSYTII